MDFRKVNRLTEKMKEFRLKKKNTQNHFQAVLENLDTPQRKYEAWPFWLSDKDRRWERKDGGRNKDKRTQLSGGGNIKIHQLYEAIVFFFFVDLK